MRPIAGKDDSGASGLRGLEDQAAGSLQGGNLITEGDGGNPIMLGQGVLQRVCGP
jgi:hypothetical protein